MSYTNKAGQDLYDRGAPLYYAVQILLLIYAVGYMGSLVLLQNAQVVHTHTKGFDYGPIYSNRFDTLYWFALMFSGMRIFVIIFVCLGILFRKTTCCGCKFNCCTGIWISLLIIVVMFDFLVLSILSTHYSKCNGLDQIDNPCNDKRWCCVEEVFVNPANKCGAACTPFLSYDTLVADVDFIWIFALTVCFCAFDLVFMLLPIGLWLNGGMQTSLKIVVKDDDIYNALPSAPPAEAAESTPLLKEALVANKFVTAPRRKYVTTSELKMTKQT